MNQISDKKIPSEQTLNFASGEVSSIISKGMSADGSTATVVENVRRSSKVKPTKLSIDVKTIKVVGMPSAPCPQKVPSLDQFLGSIRPTLKPSSPDWRLTEAIRLYDIMRAEAALFESGREQRTTTEGARGRLKVIYPGVF